MQIAATRLGDGAKQFLVVAIAYAECRGEDPTFQQSSGMAGDLAAVFGSAQMMIEWPSPD